MAKPKRKSSVRGRNAPWSVPRPASNRQRAEDEAADLAVANDRADDDASVAAALAVEGLPSASKSADSNVLSAYDKLERQAAEYVRCAAAATAREKAAEERVAALAGDRERLSGDLAQAAAARVEAEKLRNDLAEESKGLRERAEQLRAQEEKAKTGFAEVAARLRAELDAELERRRHDVVLEEAEGRQRLADAKAEQVVEIEKIRQEKLADVDRLQVDLERGHTAMRKDEEALRFDRGALRGLEIQLERRIADLDAEVAAQAAAEIAALDRDAQIIRIEHAVRGEAIEQLRSRLSQQEAVLAKLGSTDPQHLLDEVDRLRQQSLQLRDKLAARLDDDDLTRLRHLEQRNRDLNVERDRLAYQLQELEGAALAGRINNLQMKQLGDAERHFQVLARGYEGRIAELRQAVEDLYRDRPDPGTPLFPRCVAMDDDPDLDEANELAAGAPDLAVLARSLQTSMFVDGRRAYRINDIALVLGGLAMSHLHVLEGMSGIGKTSLPVALAAALGTGCSVVEVQAGWRDRADLFGHHNTFERRFEESEFLQALYRAQTPKFRDRPYFVVLDEMNLSRPEQYFSVILSKLENNQGPIQLVTSGGGRAPRELLGGTQIRLPDNVWFIGTANQDESTLEFADKTYSRAHVMELPSQPPHLLPNARQRDILPYSTDALRRSFSAAAKTYRADTEAVRDLIRSISGELHEYGKAVMGPRLEKQMEAFVPVVVAARRGDTAPEGPVHPDAQQDGRALAADHFLSMKILRSLRGRYDVTSDGLDKLRDGIRDAWELKELSGTPERCVNLIDDEQRRRDG